MLAIENRKSVDLGNKNIAPTFLNLLIDIPHPSCDIFFYQNFVVDQK